MKLAALCIVTCAALASAPGARGDVLREYGMDVREQRATMLRETACDVEVELRGAVAHVTTRRTIANGAAMPLDADYEAELPAGAVVDAASVRIGAHAAITAIAVRRDFDSRTVEDRGAVGEDPLLVSAYADDRGVPHYRAVIQSIEPDASAELAVRWTAVATIRDGAIVVRVPGRGGESGLPACHGHATATAGPGATIARVRVGDHAAAGGARFELAAADVDVRAELAFESPRPIVWTTRAELAAGWATELVTELAPPATPTATHAKQALFVIDHSRSMAMIGDAAVVRIVGALADALPRDTRTMAIVYDRSAETIGDWQAADRVAPTLEVALRGRAARNGSDLGGALALARQLVTAADHQPTAVFVVTDGGLGTHADDAKTSVLAGNELHAIVLSPAHTAPPSEVDALRASAAASGGSYVEVPVDELGAAVAHAASWVQPGWTALELAGVPARVHGDKPVMLAPGEGASMWFAARGPAPDVSLSARHLVAADQPPQTVHIAARARIDASIASLALANGDDFPTATDERAALAHRASADSEHVLVGLAAAGRVASQRRAMVIGGGPYTRIVAVADPAWRDDAHATPSSPGASGASGATTEPLPSAIQRLTLERLFRDQLQLPAYACYERALMRPQKFSGTVGFELEVARGEIVRAATTPTGDGDFDQCLLAAAYAIEPPYPDFRINADDETLARYPLTFRVEVAKPIVVLGDADSSSPIDIESLGKAPVQRRPSEVDAKTPLGGMAPPK